MTICIPKDSNVGEGAGVGFQKVTLSQQVGAAWLELVDLDGEGNQDVVWVIFGDMGRLILNSEIKAYLQD